MVSLEIVKMQTLEKNIYLNFTKAVVDGFEEFVTSVEKHESVIEDVELKCQLKLISKKLQTIFNKWENIAGEKRINNSTTEETIKKEIVTNTKILKRSDSWDEFDIMIASSVGDAEAVLNKDSVTEVSSSSNKLDFSILDIIASKTENEISESDDNTPLSRKDAEIVRKFKIENVREEWVRGSNGFYVEQTKPGSWKCNPCKLEALSYANIVSHASGKGHIRKLENYNREASESKRKNEVDMITDLSEILSDIKSDLQKTCNGANIIVPFNGYYCNACRGTLNSEAALRLHVTGGKHRKNCES